MHLTYTKYLMIQHQKGQDFVENNRLTFSTIFKSIIGICMYILVQNPCISYNKLEVTKIYQNFIITKYQADFKMSLYISYCIINSWDSSVIFLVGITANKYHDWGKDQSSTGEGNDPYHSSTKAWNVAW